MKTHSFAAAIGLAAAAFLAGCGQQQKKTCPEVPCIAPEVCNVHIERCVLPPGAGGGNGSCGPLNCDGCCSGNSCSNQGTNHGACGTAGVACRSCTATENCQRELTADGGSVDAGRGLAKYSCSQPTSGTGGGSGGGGGTVCTASTQCSGATPVCDPSAAEGVGACVLCTAAEGCTTPTPFCLTGVSGGQCVQCRTVNDCSASNLICDSVTSTCVPPSGTGGGGGGTGGGSGGFPNCVPRDAGVVNCTTECPQGFHCDQGRCVLNGGAGPVQVTLRWNTQEDLDLHLDEPRDGGWCEIFYGNNTDDAGSMNNCGAVGRLDLDSEAACFGPDFVEVENIIYPQNTPAPSGTYTVRIDHYENCNVSLTSVPFQVEVRNNGQISGFCGVFVPTDLDWNAGGSIGGGRQVMTFVVP